MRLLFSQGYRSYLASANGRCQLYPSTIPLLPYRRYCSDSKPNLNTNPLPTVPESPKPRSQSVSIQPVSYAIKPKDQTPLNENENENEASSQASAQPTQQLPRRTEESLNPSSMENRRSWTREDIRFVKDVPSISPVSYPTRVAPLPEDRVKAEGEGESVEVVGENVKESTGDMERERMRIEAENHRRRRRIFRVVEEENKTVVPFPRLIMPEKKEKKHLFDLMDAIKEMKATARKTFDEAVEAHVRLGIDKARSDLIVRGTVTLPHGGQKALRVAFFAEGADADEARAAGADVVGGVELIDEIASAGKIDFDKCFTTPQLYPRVAKLARILNRHGLMPDSKQGTVVSDVSRAVKEAKKNQIKFRMDKSAIVHVGLGKLSLTEDFLRENVGAFVNALLQAKPAGLKKTSKYAGYMNTFHICSTMGPGFPVSIQSISKAADYYNKLHLK